MVQEFVQAPARIQADLDQVHLAWAIRCACEALGCALQACQLPPAEVHAGSKARAAAAGLDLHAVPAALEAAQEIHLSPRRVQPAPQDSVSEASQVALGDALADASQLRGTGSQVG